MKAELFDFPPGPPALPPAAPPCKRGFAAATSTASARVRTRRPRSARGSSIPARAGSPSLRNGWRWRTGTGSFANKNVKMIFNIFCQISGRFRVFPLWHGPRGGQSQPYGLRQPMQVRNCNRKAFREAISCSLFWFKSSKASPGRRGRKLQFLHAGGHNLSPGKFGKICRKSFFFIKNPPQFQIALLQFLRIRIGSSLSWESLPMAAEGSPSFTPGLFEVVVENFTVFPIVKSW